MEEQNSEGKQNPEGKGRSEHPSGSELHREDEQPTPVLVLHEHRVRHETGETFKALLLEIRSGATRRVAEAALEDRETVATDQRSIWHAAEVALGVLSPGYVPKREALEDVRAMMRWLEEGEKAWLETEGIGES